MNEKLKIGIMIDSNHLAAWKYSIIEKLAASDVAFISVVIKNVAGQPAVVEKSNSCTWIYRFHTMMDRKIFARGNSYCQKKDIRALISDVPEIKISSGRNYHCFEFSREDIDKIRNYSPDIILKFGFGFLSGQILKVPEFGVWSYSMDNYDTDLTGITGYYEVVKKVPVTCSELVILDECGNKNLVISKAWESTCSYSIYMTRDRLFRRASLFTVRAIQGIKLYGKSYLEGLRKKNAENISTETVKLSVPSLPCSIGYFATALRILLRKSVKKIFYTDPFSWILLFKKNYTGDFINNSYAGFNKLHPSKDKFWADPFVLSCDDKYFIFVEEFIYSKNKGHISVLELDKDGELQRVRKLIDKPYHMSYPFIIRANDELYMIPESGGNRTIDLYKCTEFPMQWDYVKNIMNNVNAVDTTVFNYNGKWWLFTVIDEIDSSLDGSPELFLFFTDNILSENWKSHPLNPIVSDIRTARPAGKVFIHDGKMYRPSQDCSGRYGRAINICQILTLSETDYCESPVYRITPDWDKELKGTHTYNFDNSFVVTDAYSFRRRSLKNII